MTNVMIAPSEVWEYFQEHKDELKTEMHKIAESPHNSWEVWISNEDDGLRIVVTDMDDDIIDEGWATSESECKEVTCDIYACYISYFEGDEDNTDSEDDYINKEIIAERENEIDVLFQNFLFDLLPDTDEDIIATAADDIKEHVLEYIARKHRLPIYRPMYLEGEDGKDFYSEYPYEEMIFDYNPIYEPTD